MMSLGLWKFVGFKASVFRDIVWVLCFGVKGLGKVYGSD